MQNNLAVGMLAHVDAGKTTLTEAMLYKGGCLRQLGRVDHQNAFLDTDAMERKRGITIFAKQAVLPLADATLTLLDTPGHVDFSAEMERTLQVLDYAILVISGTDGVQGHTATLWQLLARYEVPVFLFINKMDMPGADSAAQLSALQSQLHAGCLSFTGRQGDPALAEEIALCDDDALARFLDHGEVGDDTVVSLIRRRKLFPCYFGSALKLDGIDELLQGLARYARPGEYPGGFGAKVYKISRDAQNNRLTHLKVTGGELTVKAALSYRNPDRPEDPGWSEKVNQIRIYSGEKFTAVDKALPGTVCAVTGLTRTYPGQGLGVEPASQPPALEPVLSYRVLLPDGSDPHSALAQLRQLEEEDPQLAVSWTESTQEIHLQLMGEVQLEILQTIISQRLGLAVTFDTGSILYRETITRPVIGMGHFEPLRHYAEVHLLLEPGPRGSGLRFDSRCSEDILPRSWQRLVLTHLAEREHPGVLTGAPVTDIKITLLTGRAHNKHTEGGDFRQATYRAVRQGLMQADCLLLEPWYRFQLKVPADSVGRAMTDLQRMTDKLSLPETVGGHTLFTGAAPVAALREYAAEVTAYTRGRGQLACSFMGFAPCLNQDEVVAAAGYSAERDTENPADSIFCAHGAGFQVKWDQVKDHVHLDSGLRLDRDEPPPDTAPQRNGTDHTRERNPFALDEELKTIYERTYGAVKNRDILPVPPRPARPPKEVQYKSQASPKYEPPDYLLVDGYNIIHGWEDLSAVARGNLDAARQALMDLLSNFRGFRQEEIILVFDAYKVPGGEGSVSRYHNISVVYTKEAETADAYIEKVTYEIGRRHRVTVATSDGAVQLIILGHGALRVTPQALRAEIEQTNADIRAILEENNRPGFSPSIIFPE